MAVNTAHKTDTKVVGREFLEMFSMDISTLCTALKQACWNYRGMVWPTIMILQEIDDAKRPKGALNGLIKIKKEQSKYGGGGLLHFTLIILIQNNKGIRFGGWSRCRRPDSLKTLYEECSTISPHCSPAGEMPLILFCRGSCRTGQYQKWGKKDLHSEFSEGSPEN